MTIQEQYENLEKTVRGYNPAADFQHIRAAFEFAAEAHKDQKRKSGEPYIIHPLAVAQIVAEELRLDSESIEAALLHDVGKPDCCTRDGQGISHFYGHNRRSAELARQALLRLKCDRNTRERVELLVSLHDRSLPEDLPQTRRFLAKTGLDGARELLVLRRADVMAQSEYQRKYKLGQLDAFARLLDEAEAPNGHEAEQMDLFTDYAVREQQEQGGEAAHVRERKLQEAMLGIKKRYGKNAILKGMNLEDGATAKERNQTIGGHQA